MNDPRGVLQATLQNSQEKTFAGVSQKESPPRSFSCKFFKILKNSWFIEHLRTAAPEKRYEQQFLRHCTAP